MKQAGRGLVEAGVGTSIGLRDKKEFSGSAASFRERFVS